MIDSTHYVKHSRSRGFTLFEVICVMAIMTVLVMVGTPDMKDIDVSSRVSMNAAQIAQVMEKARTTAIRSRKNTCIHFSQARTDDVSQCGMWLYVTEAYKTSVLMDENDNGPTCNFISDIARINNGDLRRYGRFFPLTTYSVATEGVNATVCSSLTTSRRGVAFNAGSGFLMRAQMEDANIKIIPVSIDSNWSGTRGVVLDLDPTGVTTVTLAAN